MLLASPAAPVVSLNETDAGHRSLMPGPLPTTKTYFSTSEDNEILFHAAGTVYSKLHRLLRRTIGSEAARGLSFHQKLSWFIAALFGYYRRDRAAFHLFWDHGARGQGDQDPTVDAFFTGQSNLLKRRLAAAIVDDVALDAHRADACAGVILSSIHSGLEIFFAGEKDTLKGSKAYIYVVHSLTETITRLCGIHEEGSSQQDVPPSRIEALD